MTRTEIHERSLQAAALVVGRNRAHKLLLQAQRDNDDHRLEPYATIAVVAAHAAHLADHARRKDVDRHLDSVSRRHSRGRSRIAPYVQFAIDKRDI